MNLPRLRLIVGIALLLAAVPSGHAVVDQTIQIQSTNLVLSWPSPGGYQQYSIQYRATLDTADPWTNLTNNYFANSTERTTYTIYGVVAPPPTGGGGGGTTNWPPSPFSAMSPLLAEPIAFRADPPSAPVPLRLYPPGFDLSGFLIYEPTLLEWTEGSAYAGDTLSVVNTEGPLEGGDPESVGGSGFYRVFHIPDWSFNVTNYSYDGPTFFPVDFADYMDRMENIEVLLDGQAISDAVFTSVDYQGETYWGMGIYFDLFPSGTHQIQLRTTLRLNDEVGNGTVWLVLSNLTRSILAPVYELIQACFGVSC